MFTTNIRKREMRTFTVTPNVLLLLNNNKKRNVVFLLLACRE